MIRLLKIDFRKMAYAPAFWVLCGLYLCCLGLVFYGLQEHFLEVFSRNVRVHGPVNELLFGDLNIYRFPDIWHNLAYVAGYFRIFLAIVVVIFVTNEFAYRTIRQNIIDGLSREEFLLSKLLTAVVFAFAATLFLIVLGLSLGFASTPAAMHHLVSAEAGYVPVFFLQLLVYLVFALFLSLLVRKTGITIALLLVYTAVGEPILSFLLPPALSVWLPLEAIDGLTPFPFLKYLRVAVETGDGTEQPAGPAAAMLWGMVFSACSWLIVKKIDL